jgi:mannose-6-phosphate isomerase-like protein (cupin superfamily)
VNLLPGDALTVPLRVIHRIMNTGKVEAEMTLCYSSGLWKYTAE